MATPQKKSKRPPSPPQIVHPNAAGIDIGAQQSYVAVPADRDDQSVRTFGCFTEDIHAMADWLHACQIDTVAMESTGVYWIPLFQILEQRGFDVCLVNARHAKNVPGRKTDVSDCQWLQQLHAYGLLSASFRPDDEICVLRAYWRQRDMLIRYAAAHVQPRHKALEQMNLQLHKVVSDLTGVTGMRILQAILDGQRDRQQLADLKDPRARASNQQIAKALEGDYRQEHLFALQQAVQLYRFYQQQIDDTDQQIEQYLQHLQQSRPEPTPAHPLNPAPRRKPRGHQPAFDLHGHLYQLTGVDFTYIEGFDVLTIQTIIAEVGLDPSRFPTTKHFTSWLGICPDNRITGGKVQSTRTRKVKNRAAIAFRRAAMAVAHSKGPIGASHRRMKARMGPAKAITATAHKLARIFYRLWKHPEAYDPTLLQQHEEKRTQRTIHALRKKAKTLGFQLVPIANGAQ